MAGKLVHPDIRIDALEKRVIALERDNLLLKKKSDDSVRRTASLQAQINQLAQRLNRT